VKLHINLRYEGSLTDDMFRCNVEVKAIDGWNSIASKVTYLSFRNSQDAEYNDDYKLGVGIEFFATGIVSRVDWVSAMNFLVAGLVLLKTVEQVVKVVAFYILPEGDVYSNAGSESHEYGKALAQFGLSTALACHAFKQWDTHGVPGEEPQLTTDELAEVFSGPFDKDTAERFAMTITKQVGKDALVCSDLVDLMSTGLVSIERMKDRAEAVAAGKRTTGAVVLRKTGSSVSQATLAPVASRTEQAKVVEV